MHVISVVPLATVNFFELAKSDDYFIFNSGGKAKPCPLSRKRPAETSDRDDGWHTDDSDWESSEDDEENATASRKKKKLRKNPPSGKQFNLLT